MRGTLHLGAAASLAVVLSHHVFAEDDMGRKNQSHPYVGVWVTADGYIRHELLPNGRYDEARGKRKSAYRGRYEVTGEHIEYWDDTGFTADGDFIDGVLHHAGMVLYRER
ncbi:Atu4866 domain-containing protein [Sinorhizobium meliloti]|uniref:Atu4866 domain-containing protein n=1 Tax=Rhizobium meliloti TaxID=382 RepID=UPI0002E78A47|nr:Atu4866 domain-containing protein [Sinorhizobium meliloti]MDE4586580.1 Atu4866 domain-containing protein [Sinorhizobium meliloti]